MISTSFGPTFVYWCAQTANAIRSSTASTDPPMMRSTIGVSLLRFVEDPFRGRERGCGWRRPPAARRAAAAAAWTSTSSREAQEPGPAGGGRPARPARPRPAEKTVDRRGPRAAVARSPAPVRAHRELERVRLGRSRWATSRAPASRGARLGGGPDVGRCTSAAYSASARRARAARAPTRCAGSAAGAITSGAAGDRVLGAGPAPRRRSSRQRAARGRARRRRGPRRRRPRRQGPQLRSSAGERKTAAGATRRRSRGRSDADLDLLRLRGVAGGDEVAAHVLADARPGRAP